MKTLEQSIREIPRVSSDALTRAQQRLDGLTKPVGSLGRLEELARRIAAISGKERPSLKNKLIITMAADHGVTAEGVSAYPAEVTPQMVFNFLRGGAAINVLARQAGASVLVVDMGVNKDFDGAEGLVHCKIGFGTANMAEGPAMTRAQAIASIEAGIALVEEQANKGLDIVGAGEMGIGNTTASAAITAVLLGLPVSKVTGRGTGIDDVVLGNKIRIIEKAIAVNKPDQRDPLDVLAKVGGFEIGGIAGVLLGAARRGIPALLDGFNSGAAALIAARLAPAAVDAMIASHRSVEQGHKHILDALGLKPLLDLDLRLGEGTGAALAMPLADAAVAVFNEMATFAGAGVSEKKSGEIASLRSR